MSVTNDPKPPEQKPRRHPALDFRFRDDPAHTSQRPVDMIVFGVTAVLAIAFLVWGFVSTASLNRVSTGALGWVMETFDWFFVLSASAFVVFVLWLALGKFGSIPLGRDGDEPEFRTVSWVAMMFSAGMGIGLMFYGVSEPLTFFADQAGYGLPGASQMEQQELAEKAMAQTLFHWTFHPWAIYAVVGLAIAYGTFRKGRPQLISAAFTSLIGRRRAEGPAGKVIDMLAIFATLFGSAASLGLGALQISKGVQIVGGIGELGNGILIGIITFLTICFVISAVSGVEKGIQWLSNTNMVLALLLAVFVFIAGPTLFMLDMIPTTLMTYVSEMPTMAGRTNVQGDYTADWLSVYTVFYWAWWVSWTPFVGMFIARISRGRTIRQFVTGVLLVPTLVSIAWFAIFGGAGLKTQMDDNGVNLYGDGGAEGHLFNLLEQFPFATVTSVLVMILVGIFFVSGADAASIVMGTLSQRGSIEPKTWLVVFWGVTTGAVAAVMLLVGGQTALDGLKTITILSAVPFILVMVGLCVALTRDLSRDPLVVRSQVARETVHDAVVTGVTEHGDDFKFVVEEAEVEPVVSPDSPPASKPGRGTPRT